MVASSMGDFEMSTVVKIGQYASTGECQTTRTIVVIMTILPVVSDRQARVHVLEVVVQFCLCDPEGHSLFSHDVAVCRSNFFPGRSPNAIVIVVTDSIAVLGALCLTIIALLSRRRRAIGYNAKELMTGPLECKTLS